MCVCVYDDLHLLELFLQNEEADLMPIEPHEKRNFFSGTHAKLVCHNDLLVDREREERQNGLLASLFIKEFKFYSKNKK